MFRRGLIAQQIQEMARVMTVLIQEMSGRHGEDFDPGKLSDAQRKLLEEVSHWVALPVHELEHALEQDSRFDAQNIELLADLIACHKPVLEQQQFLQRSLQLYRYADARFRTFSLSRQQKITQLLTQIAENGTDDVTNSGTP